jgi:fructose-1,6-bisphosphatase/inositol monophosphatase family enzyme
LPGRRRVVVTGLGCVTPLGGDVESTWEGAVEGRGGHIWDIAGAHAILRSHGFDLEYLSGGTINYAVLRDGSPAGDNILGGSREQIKRLRRVLRRN